MGFISIFRKKRGRLCTFSFLSFALSACSGINVPSGAFGLSNSALSATQITISNTSIVAGALIEPIAITLLDATGLQLDSTKGGDSTVVTASLISPIASAALSSSNGSLSVTAKNGVATFSTLSINTVATGYRLSFSIPNATIQTNAFNIIPAAFSASNSFLSRVPSTLLLGASSIIQLTLLDIYGNANPSGVGTVLFSSTAQPGTVTFGSVSALGTQTYQVQATGAIVGSTLITATVGGVAVPTATLTVYPIAPSSLAYSLPNFILTSGSAFTETPTLSGGATTSCSIARAAVDTEAACTSSCLPSGLSINQTTCAISGTATTASTRAKQGKYTVTASNVSGSSTATFLMQVRSATKQWAWWSGIGSTDTNLGSYGSVGVAASTNVPTLRSKMASWQDSTSSNTMYVFGGQSESGNTSDLWKWNGTQWTWVAGPNAAFVAGTYGTVNVAASTNNPGARNSPCSAAGTAAGSGYVFGGVGYASTTSLGYLNDVWYWNGTQWTWKGITGTNVVNNNTNVGTPVPGGRSGSTCWFDGTNFWVFGGYGYDTAGTLGYLQDLWKMNVTAGSPVWTFVTGSTTANAVATAATATTGLPGARNLAVGWYISPNLYLFSGNGYNTATGTGALNDLWTISTAAATNANWTLLSPSSVAGIALNTLSSYAGTIWPGGRYGATIAPDPARSGTLWLFGGNGYGSSGPGDLNDLWQYNGTTWEYFSNYASGSDPQRTPGARGLCGTKGARSTTGYPGASESAISWVDALGNYFVFGGYSSVCQLSYADGTTDNWTGFTNSMYQFIY